MRLIFVCLLLLFTSIAEAQVYSKFAPYEKDIIKTDVDTVPFRILSIANERDSFELRKPSFPVNPQKQKKLTKRFVDRLYATVNDPKHLGVGIAAPQVGVHKRIIWVQRFDRENEEWEVYFNPKIISCSGEKVAGIEGCLSIPGRTDTVFRQQEILIEYDLLSGEHLQEKVNGFTSVIFQHEIDHLNGILYLDHLRKED